MGNSPKKEINWDGQYTVNEVNKRSIGKLMVKHCGHEGMDSENDTPTQYLRKLFQGIITHLEKEKESMWEDVVVEMYGYDGSQYQITAGAGKHHIIVQLDEHDEVSVFKKK